ncbi:hypothetical protein EBA05_01905 [Xanthomonas oryzae pv. oryzae]|nr:hypothetical protein C0L90_01905 [Xanthomonas oryzae pv. oryzae]QBI14740.1 hypothetical protein EYR03_01910 [Xanthomonas oryzae pv. oryzae]QBN26295.1 hypothetical protein EBA00_20350 [Xanthomonas oryzae pv. oryzae]QBN38021.1 hypothetical protein EBA04_01910 [Xanthomonas oryzae pv. oryzae]QBN41694.1 hypothetical protein EBA05_01905 [Xanthomonas oryzae pv. oryzae]
MADSRQGKGCTNLAFKHPGPPTCPSSCSIGALRYASGGMIALPGGRRAQIQRLAVNQRAATDWL